MTSGQRISNIIGGLLIAFFGVVIILSPGSGVRIISIIISFTLLGLGIRNLWFYFTMARHMVGGKNSLYTGVILLDLAIFAFTITISKYFVMLYLLCVYASSGAIDIMLALDARKIESGSWKLKLITGIGNILIAILATVFGFVFKDDYALTFIYGMGLLYSGILRIINALRKTAIVYIQ
ncbi:MAG: DUF308 domain-containing protein [Mogibacterium sp.]|nr:DUF308 domain-containing protein [Mogibacterium sp.]